MKRNKTDEKTLPRWIEILTEDSMNGVPVECIDPLLAEAIYICDDYVVTQAERSMTPFRLARWTNWREIEQPERVPLTFDELFGMTVISKTGDSKVTLTQGDMKKKVFYAIDNEMDNTGNYELKLTSVTAGEICDLCTMPDGSALEKDEVK